MRFKASFLNAMVNLSLVTELSTYVNGFWGKTTFYAKYKVIKKISGANSEDQDDCEVLLPDTNPRPDFETTDADNHQINFEGNYFCSFELDGV